MFAWPALVAAFTAVAAAFHLLAQSRRPLWLDEACTYWTIHANAFDLLRGTRTDGTPPLYFLLVSAITHLFGSSELALRLTSIIAGTALVPAIYVVSRRFASHRVAAIAAGLTAISPLVHYYAVEARNYSLVELETLAILYVAYRAIQTPDELKWWALLAFAQTTQLWTHNYAVFLLPAPALICLVAGSRERVVLAAKAAAASSLALLLSVPCLLRAVKSSNEGVGDWLARFWESTPPRAAIFRSLEVFGFGGRYPSYLSYLGQAPAVRLVGIPLTVGVLALAILGSSDASGDDSVRAVKSTLLGFLFVPLLASWAYSWLITPVYHVGRYDTIVLPVFLIIFAIGLENILRMSRGMGIVAMTLVVGLAVLSCSTAFGEPFSSEPEDVMAAQYLAVHAAPADPIVITELREPVVAYYLDRLAHHRELVSFPLEIGQHPGWSSPARMLQRRDRLVSDAEQLTKTLITAAEHGHAVWIVASGENEIDDFLYRPLLQHLVADNTRAQQQAGVYCLTD